MDRKRLTTISKFLSRHLRHAPEDLGLTLQPGGWVGVDELLSACAARRFPFGRDELDAVVAGSDKQRFAYDPTRTCIRANQGHSVAVDLELAPVEPPAVLYHGTHAAVLPVVRAEGLKKMARQHVHLSGDVKTALAVGARRGPPVVLTIDAAAMRRDGFVFYRSANGVWLVDAVPPAYLREPETP
jgi:putative RNA 2'-phosphotransferase